MGNDCIWKLQCHCIQILHSDIYSAASFQKISVNSLLLLFWFLVVGSVIFYDTTFKYRLFEDVQTSTLSYHFFFKTTKDYLRWNLRCIYLGESINEPVSKDLILDCFRSFDHYVILSNGLVMFYFITN